MQTYQPHLLVYSPLTNLYGEYHRQPRQTTTTGKYSQDILDGCNGSNYNPGAICATKDGVRIGGSRSKIDTDLGTTIDTVDMDGDLYLHGLLLI